MMGGAFGSGLISAIISLVATYAMTFVIATPDPTWALIAVTVAGFFSGFFSYNAAINKGKG